MNRIFRYSISICLLALSSFIILAAQTYYVTITYHDSSAPYMGSWEWYGIVEPGSPLDLTAIPNLGYEFYYWRITDSQSTYTHTPNPPTFTMYEDNLDIEARFAIEDFPTRSHFQTTFTDFDQTVAISNPAYMTAERLVSAHIYIDDMVVVYNGQLVSENLPPGSQYGCMLTIDPDSPNCYLYIEDTPYTMIRFYHTFNSTTFGTFYQGDIHVPTVDPSLLPLTLNIYLEDINPEIIWGVDPVEHSNPLDRFMESINWDTTFGRHIVVIVLLLAVLFGLVALKLSATPIMIIMMFIIVPFILTGWLTEWFYLGVALLLLASIINSSKRGDI